VKHQTCKRQAEITHNMFTENSEQPTEQSESACRQVPGRPDCRHSATFCWTGSGPARDACYLWTRGHRSPLGELRLRSATKKQMLIVEIFQEKFRGKYSVKRNNVTVYELRLLILELRWIDTDKRETSSLSINIRCWIDVCSPLRHAQSNND